jgi:trigger factor
MQVTKEQIDPCTLSLDFEIEPEAVTKGFNRAYREFAEFTNVPGFRPGKAPRAMLERYVNQERLRERVMELLATPAYRDAITQESVTPYSDPEVDFSDIADGKPWQFKATVPLPPKVTLGDYKTIEVERPIYTVTDVDIERQMENLRNEYARLNKIEGRPVQAGDVLIAETLVTSEGAENAEQEPRRTLLRLGDNIPGFDDAVIGQQIDEERTFTLTYPEDYQDAEVAGKPATFRVKVLTINERIVPELTDEWVAEVTSFKTVAELREDFRKKAEKNVHSLSDQIAEGRIIQEIVKRSEISYPRLMVQQEMENDVEEFNYELEQRQMDYEQFLERSGKTAEQHHAELEAVAEERLKGLLALREIAQEQKIGVTNEEIDAEFHRLAAENEVGDEELQRVMREDRRRVQVSNLVVKRKLRDYLFATVTVKDVPATENS